MPIFACQVTFIEWGYVAECSIFYCSLGIYFIFFMTLCNTAVLSMEEASNYTGVCYICSLYLLILLERGRCPVFSCGTVIYVFFSCEFFVFNL